MVETRQRSPQDHLPLTPFALWVLLALADGDRHGYAILKEVRRRTGALMSVGASSLYAALNRLLAAGLVAETEDRPDPALDDERRRYYRLTPLGRRVAVAELKRLESVVAEGRAKRLLFGPGRS